MQTTRNVIQMLLAMAAILPASVLAFAASPTESHSDAAVDFSRQVVPLLTQAGCNAGACHGAAAGRGYLNLSLFGSRPSEDYEAILHAPSGRFIDLQEPLNSLLLQKPGGYLEHGGEVRLDSDGQDFALIMRWIEQGAAAGSLQALERISISPSETLQTTVGKSVSVQVTAHWEGQDNGTPAHWLRIDGASLSEKSTSAKVVYSQTGTTLQFTPMAAGYWPVTIRVGPVARTIQIWAAPDGGPASTVHHATESEFTAPKSTVPEPNAPTQSIDSLVAEANRRIGNALQAACSDTLLARRLYVDLLGRHPQEDEWQRAILQLQSAEKNLLVDQLLKQPEFMQRVGEVVVSWIAETSSAAGAKEQLAGSVADFLSQRDDIRRLATAMLSVEVPTEDVEGIDASLAVRLNQFHQFAAEPRSRAELVASAWLGVRVGCAQCHDHPLDHWTQDDYFAMAACWAEIESGGSVRRIPGRTTTDLRSGLAAQASLPGSSEVYAADVQRRPADLAFVDWLTRDDNPALPANIANRTWFWLLGTGLVEEVDDQRATNPAINAELLTYLSRQLVEHDFSMRSLVREIVLSDAYARVADATATRLAQRLVAARTAKTISLPIETLSAGALGVDLGSKSSGNAAAETMMMMAAEPEAGCGRYGQCADPFQESIGLVTGDAINRLVAQAVEQAWQAHPTLTADEVLTKLHGRVFGSTPDEEQLRRWSVQRPELRVSPDSIRNVANRFAESQWIEDIVWSWLVSPEFRQLH